MSHLPPPELPREVVALFELERQAIGAPPRVRVRVAERLGLPGGRAPAPAAPSAPTKPWWGSTAVKAALVVVAGAGGTVGWLTARGPSPPAVVAPPAPAPVASAGPAGRATEGTEIAALRQARAALVDGDFRGALAAVERHQRRWPAGELIQEREVLAIQALTLAGRIGEARARAERFLERFPTSTLAATVRQLSARAAGPR